MIRHLLTVALFLTIPFGLFAGIGERFISGDYQFIVTKLNSESNQVSIIGYSGSDTEITLPIEVVKDDITYTVNAISGSPFAGKQITAVTFPETYTSLSGFSGCETLVTVNYSNHVTSIEAAAFKETGLTSFTVSENISTVSHSAFEGCQALEEINVDVNNPDFTSLDGVLYNKKMSKLITYPAAKTSTHYSVPDGVTDIGYYAFFKCEHIKSLSIPASVNSLYAESFMKSGFESFSIDQQNATYKSVDDAIFSHDLTRIIVYPSAKTGSFSLPESVKEIAAQAFSHSHLSDISIPSSVYMISEQAFAYSQIQNFIIPESVTNIGMNVFNGCNATNINIKANITSIFSAFINCRNLTSVSLPNTLTLIGDNCFNGCSIESITIPENVTSIGHSCFINCDKLKTVVFNNKLQSAAKRAFASCPSLESLVFPESTTFLADFCLEKNPALVNVSLPGLKSMGMGVFSDCTALAEVNLGNLSGTMMNTFNNCTSLTSVTIPKYVDRIWDCFIYCTSLSTVISPREFPAEIMGNDFYAMPSDAVLIVPEESIPYYSNAIGWDKFIGHIQALPNVNIDSVTSDFSTEAEVFNLSGVKLTAPFDQLPSGIYILRQGNKSMKVAK